MSDNMDMAKAKNILEAESTNYKRKNRVLKGLTILSKYDEDMDVCAEHDVIYACDFNDTVGAMTEDEVTEMARLGWFEDEDSWSHFT